MKKLVRIVSLLLASTASLGSIARAETPAPTGTLSGVVLDSEQKPVAGASVFLDDYDYDERVYRPVTTTKSAADGSFHLPAPGPTFRRLKDVRIIADRFAPATVPGPSFSIIPDADVDLGKIHVSRGQILSGQVFDIDGKPAANAIVECDDRRFVKGSFADPMAQLYRLKTDADGRFTTPPLPVSYAGMTVVVPGRLRPWIVFPVGPESHAEVPAIHLTECPPILGQLKDEQGNPIAHANVSAGGWEFGPSWLLFDDSQTDDQGRFKIDGLGRRIQLQINAPDHVNINWVLRGQADGLYWADVKRGWNGDPKLLTGPVTELQIPMKSVAWISGKAIDAESGQPIHLSQIVCCNFTRKPDGEVVLNGCQNAQFQQEADGSFKLPYYGPDEFHLTISADGYRDAEAFTPRVQAMQPISGIVAKMQRLSGSASPQIIRQTLSGTITHDGKPVKAGIIAIGGIATISDIPNVTLCRGRTVLAQASPVANAVVHDGKYMLNVPYQGDDWWVRVEEPGEAITQVMNVSVKLNEEKKLDIAMVAGGGISGRVTNIPDRWKHDTWVVAVNRNGLRFESEVAADGTFTFANLPPGEFGVKAGHDAFMDSERAPQNIGDRDPAYGTPSDPWKRALMVKVESGRRTSNVAVELPER